MSLFSTGRLCVKIAGRDAGKRCVVIEQVDDHVVVVDGATRRKKVNVKHLEPLAEVLELKEKASHDDVKKIFEKAGWPVWETKARQTPSRQIRQKKIVKKTAKAESGLEGQKPKSEKSAAKE